MTALILASTSPYRRELLARFASPFDTVDPWSMRRRCLAEHPCRCTRLAARQGRGLAASATGRHRDRLDQGRRPGWRPPWENPAATQPLWRRFSGCRARKTSTPPWPWRVARSWWPMWPRWQWVRDVVTPPSERYLRLDQPYDCASRPGGKPGHRRWRPSSLTIDGADRPAADPHLRVVAALWPGPASMTRPPHLDAQHAGLWRGRRARPAPGDLPQQTIERAAPAAWAAENAKTTRLAQTGVAPLTPLAQPLQAVQITELPRPPKGAPQRATAPPGAPLLAPAPRRARPGLLSEAGLPAVADPAPPPCCAGHARKAWRWVVISGPNGRCWRWRQQRPQRSGFAFVGYLPGGCNSHGAAAGAGGAVAASAADPTDDRDALPQRALRQAYWARSSRAHACQSQWV